jgi:competence ComEA-like helix-hairpin-helix protein
VSLLLRIYRRIVWITFLTAILTGCQRCQSPINQTKTLPPLPQDPFVQVYVNHNQAAEYEEPYRQQQRFGDDLEQIIVETIAQANYTVEVAVQEFRLPKIAAALVERHQAGVKVRVILENNYSRPWSDLTPSEVRSLDERSRDRYEEFRALVDRNGDGQMSADEINQGDALVILRQAGVPVIDDTADGSKGSGLMHHKFVVVDGSTAIVTSANFTTSGIHGDFDSPKSRGNANNLLKIESVELATHLQEEFNLMWGDGPGGSLDSLFGLQKPPRQIPPFQLGNNTITVQFAPTGAKVPWAESANGLIGETLGTATRSIDLALFVFSEQQLVDTIKTVFNRGVQVRSLIDPSFAYRNYSEALDMLGVTLPDRRCRYEPDNFPWENPITTVGVPQLPPGDVLHHKFGIIDGETIITGSHNWSASANHQNDETLLVVTNPTVAAHFLREFDRLYQGATLGITAKLQDKIERLQAKCPPPQPQEKTVADPGSSENQMVNLNTATQEELETLPGVGPVLAGRIIAARANKPFTSLADLDQVPGIGPKMLEKLGDRVTF